MYHWGVDIEQLKKHPERYAIWRLEQLINYGLNGEKLDRDEVKRYWSRLHLDPQRSKFMEMILWEKKS